MCGITAVLSRTKIESAEMEAMTDSLKHRGPDFGTIYINEDSTVALGHRRLSIIDLSSVANQPMYSEDNRYILVFNGEIYNFKILRKELENIQPSVEFKTNSDTEVILHAFSIWGPAMVNKLSGMFAIVLYDRQMHKLFLFRDRMGKKPLYYFIDGTHFICASEIKALLKNRHVQANLNINRQAVSLFLHLGYLPEPYTIYKSIHKFPSGSTGEIDHTLELELNSYWNPEQDIIVQEKVDYRNENEAIAQLKGRLETAVQQRLISDVPLGAFLSGGTDSSLITAIASKHSNGKLKTFNIGFKEQQFNESQYAAAVATRLNTDHHEYILSEEDALRVLSQYLTHFDEPFADTSAIPTMLVSQLARKEVTVALTGDGGDELFWGYGAYNWAKILNNGLIKNTQTLTSFFLRTFGSDRIKRASNLFEPVQREQLRSHIFSQEQYLFSDKEIRKLLVNHSDYMPFLYTDPDDDISEPAKQALFDLKYYLKDDLLVKVDRASMFYSLECRSPLLDKDVVKFALALPDTMKHRGRVSKWILKECLSEYLPPDLIHRPKWGFGIPLGKWLKGELNYLLEKYLADDVIRETGLVKPEFVQQIKKSFAAGQNHLYNRIWALVVLHWWMERNK